MAIKKKSILGLAVALIVLTIAAVAGGLMVKADGQTWLSDTDTSWYHPDYSTYYIKDARQLAGVAELVNTGEYKFEDRDIEINGLSGKIIVVDTAAIDLSGKSWVPIGNGEHPFQGTLISKEGAIVDISGMNVKSDLSYQGLVGNMIGGTVGGFNFQNGSISVTNDTYDVYAGSAVGKMAGSSMVYDITNHIEITANSTPYITYAGGIVGMGEGAIDNSFNHAPVTANSSAAVGGIVGYGDTAGLRMKKLSNSGNVSVNAQTGHSIYAGGIAGYVTGSLTMNDENTVISNSAPVTVNGGASAYAGGIIGKADNTMVFSDATTNDGAITISAPAAAGSYAGGLIGAAGAVTSPDVSIGFANTAPVTNNGGSNVYTGGIAGYAGSTLTWTKEYTNAANVTATGSANIYTGGFIGYAAKGIVLNNPSAGAYLNTAGIQASGSTVVYTGGIAGYDAGGSISNASFTGSINVAGTTEVYTGGIVGYEIGGSIQSSQAGNISAVPTITSDGTIGGIVGYLDGTVNEVSAKYIRLTATAQGGVAGGIAGSAQGTIHKANAGDAEGMEYATLIIDADIDSPAGGMDNVTFGGLVGVNDKALTLTDSRAARVGLISEVGKKGYILGGAAGNMNTLAVIGTKDAPVTAQDFLVEVNADNGIAGGAIGINRASAMYIHANRIEINSKGAALHAGGIFGENHGTAPYVLAENIIMNSQGTDARLGGVAGLNTGSLTDPTAQVVSITVNGIRTEAGGIAGRSEGADAASSRAGIINPVFHAGEATVITVNAPEAKAGGLAGYARVTDIVNPVAGATVPDYVSLSVKAPGASAGGLVGVLENSTLSGDTTTVNLENLLINTSKEANNGYTGGLVGYNDKSRLERLVGKTLNVNVNGPGAISGGMIGYNLGTDTAVITNNYITAFSLKVNATATGSTTGGIVGLNDARPNDSALNPGKAVSSIQNSRTLGSIAVTAPSSKLGGMVGENRTLIANNSISDKISVSSKGNNVVFGGLAGLNTEKGTLYYTYSNANLTIEGAGTLAGGLAGENAGAVLGSYVDIDITGKATGTASQSVFLGGLIGRNSDGTVEQSYTASRVTANGVYTNVGGLIGELTGGSVKNSYVAKSVAANAANSYAGGFIGRITGGKVTNAYSAAEVSTKGGAYAGGFAGRYDNPSKELLYKTYYIKDESLNINKDLPDFAEGNHRWLNVHVRLTTILSATLKDRTVFPDLSGWDFTGAWKYGSLNAEYKYPEVNREANTGGDAGSNVNANINWYMKDRDAINFQITTEAELAGLASIVNGTIAGVDKFDFEGRTITVLNPIHIQSKQWVPIGDTEENAFQGTLDGGNQLIDGLTLQPVFTFSGLFGVIGEEGTVSNINLEPLSVTGKEYSGAVAGLNLGTVSNVDLKLLNGIKISGGTVGGVIGKNTGEISKLKLTLDGGSRIETVQLGGMAGGIIGDNESGIIASTYSVNAIDGSVGSSADEAIVGGIVGKQAGDVTGLKSEVNTKLRITASGMKSVAGGLIGSYTSGTASQLEVSFKDGSLEARGLDSTLGGVIGQSAAGTLLKNITVTGPDSGVQLIANGTAGAVVGHKEGNLGGMRPLTAEPGGDTFDIDQATVSKVNLAATEDTLTAVIGGIAGQAVHSAVNGVSFTGAIEAPGDTVFAGGIAGQSENTILYDVEASPLITATAKTGEAKVGGIAGLISSEDMNQGFDFGKAYPLYRGIYVADVHNGAITVSGVNNGMDLYAGGVTGFNKDASIYRSNSAVDVKVTNGKTVNAGGIAGYSNGIIVDAYANNTLNAEASSVYNVGGIVGWAEDGEIHHSEAAAIAGQTLKVGTALTLNDSLPATRAGGIVGLGDHTKITYTHAGIPVNIIDTNKDNTIYAGGFAGLLGDNSDRDNGEIRQSYATGALNVSGRLGSYVGGFAGSADRYSISNSYASGDVMNTALDTRSGGFAAAVERHASISDSFALQAQISTTGTQSATRSYTGGFAGYNDGSLNNVYANVPVIKASAPGSDFQQGALVGYNFRDGRVSGAKYVGTLAAVGKNFGSAADAVSLDKNQAPDPLATGAWNIDFDTTIMDNIHEGTVTLNSPAQLMGAVLLYNETGLGYYNLYNRTAAEKPEIHTLLLGGDIDLGGKAWLAFTNFKGKFDGQGHTISGLKLGMTEGQYAGFVLENFGEITNVNFAGAIAAGKNTGVVAGINRSSGIISNVNISGTVQGTEAAGSAAGVNEGTVTTVDAANLTLSSPGSLGGIAGVNSGAIRTSSFGGSFSGSVKTVGGITGQNAPGGTISDSMSYADIHAQADEAVAGGIAGYNSGIIDNSYSSGRISADGTVKAWSGGIAGVAADGEIISSLNTGEVRAAVNGMIIPGQAFFGGIAGQKNAEAMISNSVFNFQMLKNNIAYYDEKSVPVAGNGGSGTSEMTNIVYAAKSEELVSGKLTGGLNSEHWKAAPFFNPVLMAFEGTTEGLLSTAAVILDPKDLINRVDSSFSLGGGEHAVWNADPSQVVLNGKIGSLKTEGSTKLTVSVNGTSRSITINEPAGKFPKTAAAPAVVSGAKFFIPEVKVVLATEEPGARIYYTLDGSTPNETSLLYTAPIVLKSTTTINAVSIVHSKEYSDVFTEQWIQKAAAPAVVSGDQIFTNEVVVVLATEEPNGSIYYTLDGSTPDETSLLYTKPIVLRKTTTIKAVSVVPGKAYSDVLAGTWTLQPSPPSGGGGGGGGGPIAPIVTPAPVKEPAITAVTSNKTVNGDSEAPVAVAKNSKLKLTAPEGQTIYYTTDGTTPTVNSPKYTGELLITKSMTIKVITDKDPTVITIEYVVEDAKYGLKSNAGEVKYMAAYADNTFKPGKAITRYELIGSLAPLLDMENVNVANLFNDVTAEHAELTAFFASAGIIEGYPDGGFGGEKGLTRAEFAKVMTTVLNLEIKNAGTTKQPDLKGHWSEQYVNALSKAGYVQGFPDGTFKPNAPVTRAEAVVMINRIVGAKKLTVTSVKYKDLPATHWAFKDIMSVVQ